jgi:hypothetical protein
VQLAKVSAQRRLPVGKNFGPVNMNRQALLREIVCDGDYTFTILEQILEDGKVGLFEG